MKKGPENRKHEVTLRPPLRRPLKHSMNLEGMGRNAPSHPVIQANSILPKNLPNTLGLKSSARLSGVSFEARKGLENTSEGHVLASFLRNSLLILRADFRKGDEHNLSGTGDSQRDSRESIRVNHSQLKPHFLQRVRPIRPNHSNFRFARITRFARFARIDSRESRR